MVLQPELMASQEEGRHGLAGEGSCSDGMIERAASLTHGSVLLIHGKHKEVVGVNHRNSGRLLFSLVRRAGYPWRQWFGIKGFQSHAEQRYLWTVTGVIDSPLVVSPADHFEVPPHLLFLMIYIKYSILVFVFGSILS